jgi:hypothetical protein
MTEKETAILALEARFTLLAVRRRLSVCSDGDYAELFAVGGGEDLGEGADGAGWVGDAVVEDDNSAGGDEEDEEQGEKQVPRTTRKNAASGPA